MATLPLDPSGLDAAAQLAVDQHGRAGEPGEDRQGSLFGAPVADPEGVGAIEAAPRGRGRPPGARNRSTEEWSRFLLTRYRSPLIGLAELAQASPVDLQAELGGAPKEGTPGGCTLVEAVRLIMAAQQALAPYLHQKQPTAIDAGGVGMMQVIIQTGDGSEPGRAFDIQPIEESEEYQQLSESGADLSEKDGRKE